VIRTGYSFRVAVGHLNEVIGRIKEIGWKEAPIADYSSTFGFNKFTKLVKKAGLRPIYGIELNVTAVLGDSKPTVDRWVFLAKDKLRPLNDLLALATQRSGTEPCLTYEDAVAAPGVFKISGDRTLLEHVKKTAKDFYIGLSPSLPKGLFNEAKKRGFKFIARSNNVYPCEADLEFYRVALGWRSSTQTYPQHILSDEEWRNACDFADKQSLSTALKNRAAVFKLCKAELKQGMLLTPEKPKTLRAMCIEGAKRTGTNLNDPVYKERLERELKLIAEKNFEDYFYVIADMVNWAKERMIVGPARGSSCGSLVCYLLNITAVDPIPFGLIFERFIDTTRTDLPDIDIDFSDVRRPEVFKYAEEKYGANRVARLGTVGLFKPRSALNQAGIALAIPSWRIEKVADGIIERSGGDSRALQALEDTLVGTEAGRKLLEDFPEVKMAARMEGHPNIPSQHAAGIIITNEPIAEYVAVDSRAKAAMVDKKDAEDLNLLKIDALGLTQLSIFERTLELIGKPSKAGWLETLPLEDPKAFDVLNRGHFAGIFQFTGGALQSLTKSITVETLEDMVSITALARPGPLATGGANSWVKRKTGREPVETLHPMLTELTLDTLGIVIYQEQVMNVVRHMGKFSWDDTSAIRKAMSGRLGDEFFERYRQNFLKGAQSNGLDEATADAVWRHINTMGSWAFNRSHAVAYGLVSYWCCWLKAHHPMEFAAATLDAETDAAKQIVMLRELKNEGVDYIPVDPDHSTDRWVPMRKNGSKPVLVGPLTAIKGIGPMTVIKIMDAREHDKELSEALRKKLAEAKTEIDTLFPIGDAVRKVYPDLTMANIHSNVTPVKDVQCGINGDVLVIAVVKRIAPTDENEPARMQKRKMMGRPERMEGPTSTLNLFVADDTDEIFCKIGRFDYERIGREVFEHGRAGKAIYAIKGRVPRDFRMISVDRIKLLCDLDEVNNPKAKEAVAA
jgi:DNA polymerase III alpha subunit